MNLYESIKKLTKEADEDFRQQVLNDFKLFLDDHDIKEPTVQDINNYFTGFFYDLETEDDLNDMNKAEEIIRNEYKDALDDTVYEPTDEDVEEMQYWNADDPREDWDAGRTNDYYNESLKESLYRDKAGESGVYSYPDLLYGKEPQSEYDRLLIQYMDTHDAIRDEIAKAVEDYKDDLDNPEYTKIRQDLEIKDRENQDLFTKAEQIPEEERGPLYQEFLKIDAANNEQFAKDRGFNSYEDYDASLFGEAEETDGKITPEEFLDSTIDVYDIAAFVENLDITDAKKGQYTAHLGKERALIPAKDGKFILADYEAVRDIADNKTDRTIKIDVSEKPEPDSRTFPIFPAGTISVSINDIEENAPKKQMKARDFFEKYNYNARCERNFSGMIDNINGIHHYMNESKNNRKGEK